MPMGVMYIGEVTYSVSGAGVYGAQSVLNVQVVNHSLLPRPYKIIVTFYRDNQPVDKKQSISIIMPRQSSYVTMETYQMTDYAVISLKPLIRPLPYDEKAVTPT